MNGKTCIRIDLSQVTSARQLHAALARALDFPTLYGNNWDAFWDAITGLVSMPQQLELLGWHALEQRLPHDAALLLQCLARMAQQFPSLAPHVTLRRG
ncbi:barstar family protein [Janthinobacterium psychrotolerans]|uniref:Barstar, RNAse (Barnase) inhibitor n=1 Tax=Janthinobacterium psychrotolerans TaxID=1747903 RepID=A0A1A7C1R6_9BURK|nr:barstar family protein [Janthinobacterium psychrotolerans]OBV39677.1 Barstar, RNAse (barnase) inhibitor [Janthinobacterium psychrotolerans]